MTIGSRIKRLREETGLNQSETVNAINDKYKTKINGAMWSKWENDRDTPSMDNLRTIAKYFNTTLDYLSGLSDDSSPTDPDFSDMEINEIKEYFHKNPELKMLFSTAKDVSKEDMQIVLDLVRRLKGK